MRRLVLLDRPVSEADYEGVARAIATRVGEDMCDGTTYQPTRLMYWPSAPRDVPPLYLEQEGSAFSVDACGHGTPCPLPRTIRNVGTRLIASLPVSTVR